MVIIYRKRLKNIFCNLKISMKSLHPILPACPSTSYNYTEFFDRFRYFTPSRELNTEFFSVTDTEY
jgi:hypothetical protein